MLYNFPDPDTATNWKVPLDQDRLKTLKNIIEQSKISLDAYLPDDTMKVCERLLAEAGGLPEWQTVEQTANPFFPQYNALRQKLRTYIDDGQKPELSLLQSNKGGLKSIEVLVESMGIHADEWETPGSDLEQGSDSDTE